MAKPNPIIDLSDAEPFAEGGRRWCYRHPDNPDLCIKIAKQEAMRQRREDGPFYRRLRPLRAFDDNHEEIKGYRQLPVRRVLDNERAPLWLNLPRCYGFFETSLGEGLVLDYYHIDGMPAPTVQDLVRQDGMTPKIQSALEDFAAVLSTNQLVTRAIIPHNIVMAADGRIKLIDGIGGRNLIPIAEWFPFPRFNVFARRKSAQRIGDMWTRIEACQKTTD